MTNQALRLQIAKRTWWIPALFLACLVVILLTQVNYGCDWTGFGACVRPKSDTQELRPEKTLWDWLQLLIVPLVLALGGFALNRAEKERDRKKDIAQKEQEQAKEKYEREVEQFNAERRATFQQLQVQSRAETERHIAVNSKRETTLQTYLDRMSELLLKEKLRESASGDEVRAVARARTLTTLRQLDGHRKALLVRFLYEAELINDEEAVIDLSGADLTDVTFVNVDFAELRLHNTETGPDDSIMVAYTTVDLTRVNLSGAYFFDVDLSGAKLVGANLRGANLTRAKLQGTDLLDAEFDVNTEWPEGFDPNAAGAVLKEQNSNRQGDSELRTRTDLPQPK